MKNIVNGKAYILTTLIQINNLVIQKTEENTSVTFLYETVSGLSGCRLVVIKKEYETLANPKVSYSL